MQFIKSEKFIKYLKIILVTATVLGLGFLTYSLFIKKEDVKNVIKVTRESISQVVEVSGAVEPSKKSDINFERSGTVSTLSVKVGDAVRPGQVLATLSGSDAYASIVEAQAGVVSAQANLESVKSGATQAEIDIKIQNLENAKLDLANTESQIQDTVRNTENIIRDVIDYKLASLFYKDSSNYRSNFNSCDQSAQSDLEKSRIYFDSVKVTDIELAKIEADKLNVFVSKINALFSLPCSVSDPGLTEKRLLVSGTKSQVQSIFLDISNKKSLVQNSKNALARAEKDLSFTTARADKNRVSIAEASLNQAYARLSSARNQAGKNILSAPFAGVISQVNIEKGEIASQSKSAISIISDSKYQIKSKIAEADIAKVSMGDKATVTVDAYPGQIFMASVTNIDPASTNDGGVPRYGVTLTFVDNYENLKSGMTANADITTKTNEGALVIPVSYITIKSGGGIVKVKSADGKEEEKIVKTGTRSQDGKIEILEGLSEGDELVK